jgi:hypothetical protein
MGATQDKNTAPPPVLEGVNSDLLAFIGGEPAPEEWRSYSELVAAMRTHLPALLSALAGMREDAERWRALMASQRIRVMGSSGLYWDDDGRVHRRADGHMHLGVELWNQHEAPHPSAEFPQDRCRELLTFYVARVRADLAGQEKIDG